MDVSTDYRTENARRTAILRSSWAIPLLAIPLLLYVLVLGALVAVATRGDVSAQGIGPRVVQGQGYVGEVVIYESAPRVHVIEPEPGVRCYVFRYDVTQCVAITQTQIDAAAYGR